ncbi:bifunctional folylpolyglutamate synthase/dihydrofolate synthase [candidate division KSB1 bacterium]|nr:bifunctional folylpolyglutamate synthase/dihydrofolate synthase [candidate division KSB1 bacterium]
MSKETQRFLDSLGFFGWQLGLERIEKLCEFFGQPQHKYPTVHIAGTNGKGSTAAMLAAIGKAAGLRTGLYTSPHLVHLNERIQIDGTPVSFQEIEETLRSCRPLVESLQATYFEVITAIAFEIFAQRQVDLAIIETGLGGRLDATNVMQPEVTIITSIGLEHQTYLGRTLAQIAGEKAGIIKKGVPCVSGIRQKAAQAKVLEQCRNLNAPCYDLREQSQINKIEVHPTSLRFTIQLPNFNFALTDIDCALTGRHQANNAGLAILAAVLLREKNFAITADVIHRGLQTIYWPARLQIEQQQPTVLVDAAHNADGMRVLVRHLAETFSWKRLLVVMGLLEDKMLPPILKVWKNLRPHFVFATPPTDRARPAAQLAKAAKALGFVAEAVDSPAAAFTHARADCGDDDLLCVTGSHYLIGELMKENLLPAPY